MVHFAIMRLGTSPPTPPSGIHLSYPNLLEASFCFRSFGYLTLGLSSIPLPKSWLSVKHRALASNLPLSDIFVPQKVPFLKIYEVVIACDSWFAPLPFFLCLCLPENHLPKNIFLYVLFPELAFVKKIKASKMNTCLKLNL